MMEMKIVLIMVLHEFDLEIAYDELDREQQTRSPNAKTKTVDGERAYQLTLARPSDGLPCRAKLRVKE